MASKQIASDRPSRLPTITAVEPPAAIAGGEVHIKGRNLAALGRPSVHLGGQQAHLVIAGDSYIIAKVPDATTVGELVVRSPTASIRLRIPQLIAKATSTARSVVLADKSHRFRSTKSTRTTILDPLLRI
jgi:hypothetical protein